MSTSELSLEHSKIVAYFNPIVALKDIESAVFFLNTNERLSNQISD